LRGEQLGSSHGLTCKELVEIITDYVEGTMPQDERRRFDEHLAVCSGCEHYVDQTRSTIQAVGSLREEMIAPETREALLAMFRDWRGPS
jgi:anti-sigma factor RsiW